MYRLFSCCLHWPSTDSFCSPPPFCTQQAAFSHSDAMEGDSVGGVGGEAPATPSREALAKLRQAQQAALCELLGDEEALCVLCKEKLGGGTTTEPHCTQQFGLIARIAAQRLPQTQAVRGRQVCNMIPIRLQYDCRRCVGGRCAI